MWQELDDHESYKVQRRDGDIWTSSHFAHGAMRKFKLVTNAACVPLPFRDAVEQGEVLFYTACDTRHRLPQLTVFIVACIQVSHLRAEISSCALCHCALHVLHAECRLACASRAFMSQHAGTLT